MSDEDRGIYISFQTHLKGDVYDMFKTAVEKEARAWLQSEKGQKILQAAVETSIRESIGNHFGYSLRDYPAFKRFQSIVTDEVLASITRIAEKAEDPK